MRAIRLTACDACATLGVCCNAREIGDMERDRGDFGVPPADIANAGELVHRAVRDIDANGTTESDLLLTDLLCAAWPTPRAQAQ